MKHCKAWVLLEDVAEKQVFARNYDVVPCGKCYVCRLLKAEGAWCIDRITMQ